MKDGRRCFEGCLLGFVKVKFNYGFDSSTAYDARSAESDVVKAVLAAYKSGDDKDRALVAENGLADARDAGGDGEAGVSFEGSNHRTGVADSDEEFFVCWELVRTRVVSEREASDLRCAPDSNRRISMFADDGSVN